MSGLTANGFSAPSLAEIKAEIEAELRSNVSPTLDLSASSPLGQMVAIQARQIRKVWEAQVALYGAMNPDGATGVTLDHLSALTGVTRKAATKSRVSATVNVDPGTYLAGTLVANVVGRPVDRFTNLTDVVNSGGSPANVQVTFEAETAGPVAAVAGTLTEISGPVSGWNSVINAGAATLGTNTETDAELRVRRADLLQSQGSTTVDAIRDDIVNNVSGVLQASVVENVTDSVDSEGLLPHSIEAIVYGPVAPTVAEDLELATQIFLSKPAGIATNGTTTVVVEDSQGNDHDISFTRPVVVEGEIQVIMGLDREVFPSVDGVLVGSPVVVPEIQTQLQALAADTLGVGDDLTWSIVTSWALSIPGVKRVTFVAVGPQGFISSFSTLDIDTREIASLALGDILAQGYDDRD